MASADSWCLPTVGFCRSTVLPGPWLLLTLCFYCSMDPAEIWLLMTLTLGPYSFRSSADLCPLLKHSSCRPMPSVNPWLVLGISNPSEDSGFQKTRSQFRVGLEFQQRSVALIMETAKWYMILVHTFCAFSNPPQLTPLPIFNHKVSERDHEKSSSSRLVKLV